MKCSICERLIEQEKTGEPYLPFKNKFICAECFLCLSSEIYLKMCFGNGGIVHLIYSSLVKSGHNRKKHPSLSQNKKLFERLKYKYNFKCVHCESTQNLTVDHIHPVSKGGSDKFENLQILCKPCNSKKGAKWNV